jgi:hypothetical protein
MTTMAGAGRQSKTQGLSAKAKDALSSGEIFEAERAALKALMSARAERDFARMATIVPTLLEARMRRVAAATAGRKLSIIDSPIGEDVKASKGCFLVQPPQVGADARRLRVAAFEQNVPLVVLCREPLTQVKLLPIVAISPGVTVRTKVRPPKNMDKPDFAWFEETIEALGTFAIETLDAAMPAERRVDALLERLDAMNEHEGLHHALQQACLDAQIEREKAKAARGSKKAAASIADDGESGEDLDAEILGDESAMNDQDD